MPQFRTYFAWLLLFALSSPLVANAVTSTEFNPHFIISDPELQDYNSWTSLDIQNFLDSKGSYLRQYQTTDASGTEKTAAEIIYDSAQTHQINPKYLLVTLQKEQSLITDDTPSQRQLDWATGYAVCDSCSREDPKVAKHKGFGKQVDDAGGIMRWYYDNKETNPIIIKKDVPIKIDNQETSGMTVDQAVSKIRGTRGTVVTLGIFRPATQKQLEFKITRAKIELTSVKSQYQTVNGKKIAVINIFRFGDETVDLFAKAVADARNQGAFGIVLDLRDDPGGYLDGAVAVASYWVKPGDLVVSEAHSDGTKQDYKAAGNNVLDKMPTIVLINAGSASAAEIVSGALHDHGAARLLGTKSFGKGSVQELIDLPQQTALKVTIAKWLTPNGININKNGLEPDVKVERSPDQIQAKQDPQLDKALELLTK